MFLTNQQILKIQNLHMSDQKNQKFRMNQNYRHFQNYLQTLLILHCLLTQLILHCLTIQH